MHECLDCAYCYVPQDGVPSAGVSPGTPFEGLPEAFECPSCGAERGRFIPVLRPSPAAVRDDLSSGRVDRDGG